MTFKFSLANAPAMPRSANLIDRAEEILKRPAVMEKTEKFYQNGKVLGHSVLDIDAVRAIVEAQPGGDVLVRSGLTPYARGKVIQSALRRTYELKKGKVIGWNAKVREALDAIAYAEPNAEVVDEVVATEAEATTEGASA